MMFTTVKIKGDTSEGKECLVQPQKGLESPSTQTTEPKTV